MPTRFSFECSHQSKYGSKKSIIWSIFFESLDLFFFFFFFFSLLDSVLTSTYLEESTLPAASPPPRPTPPEKGGMGTLTIAKLKKPKERRIRNFLPVIHFILWFTHSKIIK
jgi:hypothetical protein